MVEENCKEGEVNYVRFELCKNYVMNYVLWRSELCKNYVRFTALNYTIHVTCTYLCTESTQKKSTKIIFYKM